MRIDEITHMEVYTGSGPLWHGTDILGLTSIINTDRLNASIDNDSGASLTTSIVSAWDFANRSTMIFCDNHYGEYKIRPSLRGAVIEFDANRLRQHYRLVHYQYDRTIDDEDEVRVLGNKIEGIHAFLTGIRFEPADLPWFAEYVQTGGRNDYSNPDGFAEKILAMARHPLARAI